MFAGFFKQFFYALILSVVSIQTQAINNSAPAGAYKNKACIECHKKNNTELINAWRTSSHGKKTKDKTQYIADCVSCHGASHDNNMVRARYDSACIECHGGNKAPVVHSYSTSKHGILMRLEHKQQNWNLPLKSANYRMPGCAYCHMHAGDHNVASSVRKRTLLADTDAINLEQMQDKSQAICQDCHSPRYVRQLFKNAESMLQIARKKIREANKLIKQASSIFSEDELSDAKEQMNKMQQHLNNVYLGSGHQSPDYQWWHGQPAMDGDLLRIKGILSQLYRQKKRNNYRN